MLPSTVTTCVCKSILIALCVFGQLVVDCLELPDPHFNIAAAHVWKCQYSSLESTVSLRDLHNNGHSYQLELLHTTTLSEHDHSVDIMTTSSTVELQQLGLTHCTQLASMEELISTEIAGNWANLQHHVEDDGSLPSGITDAIRRSRGDFEGEDLTGDAFQGDFETDHLLVRREVRDEAATKGGGDNCREGVCEGEAKAEGDEFVQWFSQYQNLTAMYQWYVKLSEAHPDTVRLNKTIGKSVYERELIALHITDRREGVKNKPVIYMQCLLHSREWISGSVCMYLAYRLATPQPSDTTLLELLREVEFVIVPVANPDGYYATWLQYPKYRLWRKNVQPLNGTTCTGVDLNRNFDSHWEQDTSSRSDDPCSELYHGPSAGSELEVQTLTSYIKSLGRVIGAIDFHSFHQKVLYPPAFSGEGVGDLAKIELAAERVATAASELGNTFTHHKMFDLYSAAGTFADWLLDYRNDPSYPASNELIPLTVELRPEYKHTSTYVGFLLPTNEILPSCQEMYSALLTFSKFVLEETNKGH